MPQHGRLGETRRRVGEPALLVPRGTEVAQRRRLTVEPAGPPGQCQRPVVVPLRLAGEALVAHAERILVVLDEAKSELAQLRREIAGELRVAAFPSIASAVFPETVKALRTVFPRLEIVIEDQGPGFKPEAVPDPTLDENLELPSGRGMILIKAYMTEVRYEGRGNRLRMLYRRPKPKS